MTLSAQSLVAELDTTLNKASNSKRSAMLRSVTDLFLNGAPHLSNDQIAVFDDVLIRLIENIERSALIELSTRLAPIGNAPLNIIGRLSYNDDIAVSAPVLSKSNVLSERILIDVAKTKGQFHLSAIADREKISAAVSDVLADRGGPEIALKLANNKDVCLSELGFAKLIKRAENDSELSMAVASRSDIPRELRPFLKPVSA